MSHKNESLCAIWDTSLEMKSSSSSGRDTKKSTWTEDREKYCIKLRLWPLLCYWEEEENGNQAKQMEWGSPREISALGLK